MEDAEDSDFFVTASADDGLRAEDYRCTGTPSYLGNANAILNFSFSFDDPLVDCSGVLTYYRLPYVLQNIQQSSEQQLGNYMQTISNAGNVAINPVAVTRLAQSIQATNRNVAQIASGVAPEITLADVAQNLGLADTALAVEFAETFAVRETSSIGVVQVNTDQIIQLGLPTLFTLPAALPEAQEEDDEETEEPAETADDEDAIEGAPIAAVTDDVEAIGPLSLLEN